MTQTGNILQGTFTARQGIAEAARGGFTNISKFQMKWLIMLNLWPWPTLEVNSLMLLMVLASVDNWGRLISKRERGETGFKSSLYNFQEQEEQRKE